MTKVLRLAFTTRLEIGLRCRNWMSGFWHQGFSQTSDFVYLLFDDSFRTGVSGSTRIFKELLMLLTIVGTDGNNWRTLHQIGFCSTSRNLSWHKYLVVEFWTGLKRRWGFLNWFDDSLAGLRYFRIGKRGNWPQSLGRISRPVHIDSPSTPYLLGSERQGVISL